MPQTYFITLASNDRWVWSTSERDSFDSRNEYRSPHEAYDDLCSNLRSRGLIVEQMQANEMGFVVKAFTKKEQADRPMLIAFAAMQYIEDLKENLDQRLRDLALTKAKNEGRTLVSPEDIQAIVDKMGATLLQMDSRDG